MAFYQGIFGVKNPLRMEKSAEDFCAFYCLYVHQIGVRDELQNLLAQ